MISVLFFLKGNTILRYNILRYVISHKCKLISYIALVCTCSG